MRNRLNLNYRLICCLQISLCKRCLLQCKSLRWLRCRDIVCKIPHGICKFQQIKDPLPRGLCIWNKWASQASFENSYKICLSKPLYPKIESFYPLEIDFDWILIWICWFGLTRKNWKYGNDARGPELRIIFVDISKAEIFWNPM